jgi:hypothetical protein
VFHQLEGAAVTGWSVNLQATEAVRRHAVDDEDKRALLEALGLVVPGSRVLVGDPDRPTEVSDAAVNRMVSHVEDGPTERPRRSFAPRGLRDYVPGRHPASKQPTPSSPPTPSSSAQVTTGAATTAQPGTTQPTPTGAQP